MTNNWAKVLLIVIQETINCVNKLDIERVLVVDLQPGFNCHQLNREIEAPSVCVWGGGGVIYNW